MDPANPTSQVGSLILKWGALHGVRSAFGILATIAFLLGSVGGVSYARRLHTDPGMLSKTASFRLIAKLQLDKEILADPDGGNSGEPSSAAALVLAG